MKGLYIHIPFCSGKCNYCDFISHSDKNAFKDIYIDALEAEMKLFQVYFNTLYIGGGTPSELTPGQLTRLFNAIEKNYKKISWFEESTFEANPESLTEEKIALLKQYGFGRVSLGLQSACDETLKFLGRRHNYKKFLEAYHNVKDAGFSVNIDLITGIQGQTPEKFKESLAQIIKLNPHHISIYALTIENGTNFYRNNIKALDDDAVEMLKDARETLKRYGYRHYEISNFAKTGQEAKHNINYWNNGEYLGLGCAAVSYIQGIRRHSDPNLESYCNAMLTDFKDGLFATEELEGKEKLGETVLLGLRKLDGIAVTPEMKKEFGKSFEKLKNLQLLHYDGETAKLTDNGIYLSNQVFIEFVAPFD